jgi:hypothetical protein
MKQTKINYFFMAAAAVFAAAYFFMVYKFMVNIPVDDDFPALQNFLVKYLQTDGFREKMSLIFADHNEGVHRLLLARLVVLVVYALSGTLNYAVYTVVINLFLIATGIFIYTMIHDRRMKGLALFTVVLLLFNSQNMIQSAYVLSGLSHVGVIFSAFLTIYLLLFNNKISFAAGILASALAIYSNGNGMLVILPVMVCLGMQKRIKALIIFGILSLAAAAFYFYNLNAARITGNSIWDGLYERIMHAFVFIGGNLWIPSFKFISLSVGLFCAAVYVWGIFNKVYKCNMFCYACLTFLYLTAFAAAAGNSDIVMPSVYRIYSSLCLILTVVLLVNNAKRFHIQKVICLFPVPALFFNLFSTVSYIPEMQKLLEAKKVSAYNWIDKGSDLPAYLPYAAESSFYLKQAEALDLYKMPQYPLSEYKAVMVNDRKIPSPKEIVYEIESIEEKENFLIIEGWSYFKSEEMDHTDIIIYLVSPEKQFGYKTKLKRKYWIDARKVKSGLFAVIDRTEIPSGTYRIEIGIKKQLSIKSPVLCVTTDHVLEL